MIFKDGQLNANFAQMVNDDLSFIVPAKEYNVSNDIRMLIPFIKKNKIGFVNREGVEVTTAVFDGYLDECFNENGYIRVFIDCIKVSKFSERNTQNSIRRKYGVLNSNGILILPMEYDSIFLPTDQVEPTFSVGQNYKKAVLSCNAEVIVPFGKYEYIDGFDHGYARVKSNDWGIINTTGEVVLPCEYHNIWNFYGKNRHRTRIEKDGYVDYFEITKPISKTSHHSNSRNYENTYGEYEGTYAQDVAGYSDDDINDAFDGDPDAYWNID